MRNLIWSGILVLMLLLSACGGAAVTPQPTTGPISIPVQTSLPATPERATDAPTPTQLDRATLPPEWTLTPSVTPLQSLTPTTEGTPVPTFDMINAVLLTSPTLEACASFQIVPERTNSTFSLDANPNVAWTLIPSASAYRVNLYNVEQQIIYTVIVGNDTTDFGTQLFELDHRYFWEVRPFDRNGNQLCSAIGALIVPIS